MYLGWHTHTDPEEVQWKYCYRVLQRLEFFQCATVKLVGLHNFNLLFTSWWVADAVEFLSH